MCLIKWPTHVFIVHNTVVCGQIPGVYGQSFASTLNSTLEVMGKGFLFEFLLISTFPLPTTADKQSPVQKVTDSTDLITPKCQPGPRAPWTEQTSSGLTKDFPTGMAQPASSRPRFRLRLIDLPFCSLPPLGKEILRHRLGQRESFEAEMLILPQWAEVLRWQQAFVMQILGKGACQMATAAHCYHHSPPPPHKRRRNTICLLWGWGVLSKSGGCLAALCCMHSPSEVASRWHPVSGIPRPGRPSPAGNPLPSLAWPLPGLTAETVC